MEAADENDSKTQPPVKKCPIKLSEDQINDKIKLSVEKLRVKTESLKSFVNDLQPQTSKEFIQIIKSINYQYHCLNNFDVRLDDFARLRLSNATVLLEIDAVDVLLPILIQLFDDVMGKDYSNEIDDTLYSPIRILLSIFLNYSDASPQFGNRICQRDKLLNLLYKVIDELKEKCLANKLSKNLTDILRMCLSILYNTLMYEDAENLTKIKEKNFLNLIKDYIRCPQEKIRRSALLFTAYVADESESKLFKSDPKLISYLIDLLKKSMNTKFGRSQGLSTDELSKGIEKLSKNDENKQLLVDLGILPVLQTLMNGESMEQKKTAISILWNLAFDDRNRKIIIKEFSSNLLDLKTSLNSINKPTSSILSDPICLPKSIEISDNIPIPEYRSPSVPIAQDATSFGGSSEYFSEQLASGPFGPPLPPQGAPPPAPPPPPAAIAPPKPIIQSPPSFEGSLAGGSCAPPPQSRARLITQCKKSLGSSIQDVRESIDDIYDKTTNNENSLNESNLYFKKDCSGNTNATDNGIHNDVIATNDCKQMLAGLMWTLSESEKGESKKSESEITKTDEDSMGQHIMISYCWVNSEIALKIYEALKEKDYKLWIDKHNMTDTENLMESMAQAVEKSFAVIICVSQNYKNSTNCRAEAQYAALKKKPVIPVMVQEKYRPDGWLGFCIIGLQYCDFIGRYTFEDAFSLLLKQIIRIKMTKKSQNLEEIDSVDSTLTYPESCALLDTSNVKQWTNSQTINWFKEIGIERINWKAHYSGLELEFLKTVCQVPGETFYQICRTELEISDLKDLRILYQHLRAL